MRGVNAPAAVLLLLLGALAAPVPGRTQTAAPPAPTAPKTVPPAGAAPTPQAPGDGARSSVPGTPPVAPEASQDILKQTLALDIRTASYYELLAWCRRLGLPDTGGRAELQQRLLAHYGLAAEEAAPAAGEETRNLQIESARESEYFTLEQVDQKYVVLRGGVRIELREGDTLHSIRAERVTLNQTESLLTAEGGVEYVMTQGSRTDRFSGDSLTFNTRTLEGVFFGGGTEAEQEVGGQRIRFRFVGDSITRLENNTVIMERARITSSKNVDPYYHIRARKVWVLASGEWAVLGALLYVGRVPLVYLPFFFYPGEEFFFHPVIGSRDREGSFLQTTTYLLGQKKRSRTPLSILSLDTPQDEQLLRRRRGLFLAEVPGRTVAATDLDRYLTVMLDLYSRLGLFAGVSGNFPPEVRFSGGIGFSRSLFNPNGVYTPYWPDPSGGYRTFWNESSLLGLDLPFRYGIDSSWQFGGERLSLSGRFEAYSDPFFPSDFFDRAEELNWSGLLGLEGGSGLPTAQAEKLNLTWELTAKADFSRQISSPFFQSASVQYLQTRMFWQSRLRTGIVDPIQAADPSRRFYYPVSLQLPNMSLNVSGELFRTSSSARPQAAAARSAPPAGEAAPPGAEGYRAPAGEEEEAGPAAAAGGGAAGSAEAEPELQLPGPREDLPLPAGREGFLFRLGYQLRPDLIIEELYDSSGWTTPESIDYDVLYTTLRLTDTATLSYELTALQGLLGLSGGLSAVTTWRDRFRGVAPEDEAWQGLIVGDLRQTRTDFSTLLNLNLRPMLDLPGWERSRLTYSLNWIFLRHQLREAATPAQTYANPVYGVTGPDWTADTVKANRMGAVLEYRPADVSQTLTLAADLPPFTPTFTGRLQFTAWLLTTTVSTVLREDGGDWELQPLVVQEALNIGDRFQAAEELRFDLQQGLFLKSVSTLNWGGLSASLSAERLPLLTFVAPDWVPAGGPDRVQLSQLKLGWELQPRATYLWKNRIWAEPRVDASYAIDLTQFTGNSLDFVFGFRLFIYQFLELSFTTASSNTQTYRWFPAYAEKLGLAPVNPFIDLLRSFNFFNPEDRILSAFKLRNISLQAVHHLRDWDLSLTYEGRPNLFSASSGQLQYRWENTLIILLQWVPLPPVRSRVWLDTTGFYVRG